MVQQQPLKLGRYTLHQLVARGGMAEIWRATMPGIGGFEKTVAIKKILPHLAENEEFVTMLIDEARIIEGLNHSNIAQVYDLGCVDDTYYIAMEFVHGVDLASVIKEMERQGKQCPIPHVTYIGSCICAGLHVAHSQKDPQGNPLNIVHRDVSLHNVLISFSGDVKIIDFGVAKASVRDQHTKMGVIKGKLLYMAPEQAMAKPLDGRADLFAAGLCVYKMLTGVLPFAGENEFQIYNNILSKEITPPKVLNPQVPEELNQVVMTLLQRDPDKRYQDGFSAKQDLDRALHHISPGYTATRLSRFIEDNFMHLLKRPEPSDSQDAIPADEMTMLDDGSIQDTKAQLSTPDALRERVMADGMPRQGAQQPPPGMNQGMSQPGMQGQGPGQGGASPFGSSLSPNPNPNPFDSSHGGMPPQPNPNHAPFAPPETGAQRTSTAGTHDTGEHAAVKPKAKIPPIAYGIAVLLLLIVGMGVYQVFLSEPGEQEALSSPDGTGDELPLDAPDDRALAAKKTADTLPANNTNDETASETAGNEGDAVAEAEASHITVKLESTPSGASVLNGTESLGVTPLEFKLGKDSEALSLILRLEGHSDQNITLDPSENIQRTIELSPKEAPKTEEGAEKTDPGSKTRSSSTKRRSTPTRRTRRARRSKKVEKKTEKKSDKKTKNWGLVPMLKDNDSKKKKNDKKKNDGLIDPF